MVARMFSRETFSDAHSVVRRAFSSEKTSAAGTVTVELALVAPALILLLAVTLFTGRIISQLAWMSQTALQAYLIGAEQTTPGERASAMDARWIKLLDGNYQMSAVFSGPRSLNSPTYSEVTSSGVDMVAVRVAGDVLSLLGPSATLPLSVTITGPSLAPAASVTDLSAPDNPDEPLNCNGVAGGGGSTASCGICPTSSNCFCPGPNPYAIPCPVP